MECAKAELGDPENDLLGKWLKALSRCGPRGGPRRAGTTLPASGKNEAQTDLVGLRRFENR